MLFSEFVEINPEVKLKKGDVYPFIEMEDIIPGMRYVYAMKNKVFNGGGARFQEGDIIFARITPCLENGKIAQVKGKDGKCFGSTEFFVFRAKNGISDKNFLFYLCYSDIIRKPAEKSMSGTSGRQRVSIETIKNIEIPEISLEKQQKIASILSAYDDLIENNTRRIKILEQMADAIYKEWFVKFKFPGHEKVRFVDSELGKIPEGWEVKSFLEISSLRLINENVLSYEGFKRYFATADVDGIDFVKDGIEYKYNEKPSRAQKQPIPNSVWFARMKDTYKILIFSNPNIDLTRSIMLSSGFVGFEAISEEWLSFLFITVKSEEFNRQKDLFCTGATQMSLTNEGLARIKWLFPKENLIKEYDKLVRPLIDLILICQKQNKILRKTRDILLPKLISGELDVSNLEIKVKEEIK